MRLITDDVWENDPAGREIKRRLEAYDRILAVIQNLRKDYTGLMYNDYDDGVNAGVTRACDAIERVTKVNAA